MCSHHLIVYQLLKKQPLSTSHQYTSTSMLSHVAVANSEVGWVRNMKSKRLLTGSHIFFYFTGPGGGGFASGQCKLNYMILITRKINYRIIILMQRNCVAACFLEPNSVADLHSKILDALPPPPLIQFSYQFSVKFCQIIGWHSPPLPRVSEILDPPLELVVSWTRLFLFNSNSLTTDCRHFNFGLILLTKENPMIKTNVFGFLPNLFSQYPHIELTFCTLKWVKRVRNLNCSESIPFKKGIEMSET